MAAHAAQGNKNAAFRVRFEAKAKRFLWTLAERQKHFATRLKVEANQEDLYHRHMQDLRARAVVCFWRYAGEKCGDAIGMAPLWESIEEVLPELPAKRALRQKVTQILKEDDNHSSASGVSW